MSYRTNRCPIAHETMQDGCTCLMTYNGELCFCTRAAVNEGLSSEGDKTVTGERERERFSHISSNYANIFVLVTKCSLELSIYARMYAYSDTHRHSDTHKHTHARRTPHTHTHTQHTDTPDTHRHGHKHMHTHTTHRHTQTHTHKHMHTHNTDTHTTQTHTQYRHTHTHTQHTPEQSQRGRHPLCVTC